MISSDGPARTASRVCFAECFYLIGKELIDTWANSHVTTNKTRVAAHSMEANANDILREVTTYYLESDDFNGTSISRINCDLSQKRIVIGDLVRQGLVTIALGDVHPNPHIKAFAAESFDTQLEKIASADIERGCLYPSPEHLAAVVNRDDYLNRPFTLELALGAGQLELRSFDLKVLEDYRRDPRYHYDSNDIQGWISVADQHYESTEMKDSDKILLKAFGFGYDKGFTTRVVVAWVADLADLSPEHQQRWHLHRATGTYIPHPDFWNSQIHGHFHERASLFTAFVEELRQINKMAEAMERPALFKDDFCDGSRPKEFSFLIRPTLSAFNTFVHTLDKMIADNIDFAFFGGDIALEFYEARRGEPDIARSKGTLRVLKEWVEMTFTIQNPTPRDKMNATLHKIHHMRRKPAHVIERDVFDQKYFREQRELMMEAYEAIRTLRLILANHPKANGHKVPDWLYEGKIWMY